MDVDPPLQMQHKAMEIMKAIPKQQFRLVAFIVKNGNIISVATNNVYKTHPDMYKYNPKKCCHAEFMAIKRASFDKLKGAIIYVFRLLNKIDKFALALPCLICQEFIREAKIKRIIYSTNNGFSFMKV